MRRAAKVDANQADIVAALRAIGASVTPLHAVGNGVPDLLVGFRRQTWLIEVKDGNKPPSARRLTPDQQEWHASWRGGPVAIVEDAGAALAVITGQAELRGVVT
jgi:hypothetical protein